VRASQSAFPGPNDIGQKNTLKGLICIALNDLSVSSVRISVRMLELANPSKDETTDLIQSLIGGTNLLDTTGLTG
jgi:hypothetical protein